MRISLGIMLLVCLFSLNVSMGIAQTKTEVSETKKLQQLYISLGSGASLTNGKYYASNGAGINAFYLSLAVRNNYLFRAEYNQTYFAFKGSKQSYSWPINSSAIEEMNSYSLSLGKRKQISKFIQLNAFAGASYNLFYDNFEYRDPRDCSDLVLLRKPGLIIQTEAMLIPVQFIGLSIGGYYHFVPKMSNAGITLSLNLGLLRRKNG